MMLINLPKYTLHSTKLNCGTLYCFMPPIGKFIKVNFELELEFKK